MPFRWMALFFGYAFLYLPIVSVIAYSFNESRLVTVWSRFSTRWYTELLANDQLLTAAWLSVKVAAANATLAVILGVSAAVFLGRVQRGVLRSVVAGAIAALLVVPEVILGFALLVTFISLETLLGWPEGRSALTVTLTHTTLATAFVTVVIRTRLANLDLTLEEAARDLGATPARVFVTITLPLLAPALAAGWLLAFTLSFDDLVLASFTAGPSSTTLPMIIYSKVRLGVSPEINALATLLIVAVAIGIAIVTYVNQRHSRQSQSSKHE